MSEKTTTWDVIVIGGGPAGMMAAAGAAKRGRQVLLLEKNATLGKKLLITGGGRCNVMNAELDTRTLLAKYKESDKFLFSAFSQFSSKESFEFFNSRNMPTKIENEKRVFPVSDKAQSVWDVLVHELKENKVTVRSNSPVSSLLIKDEKVVGVKLGALNNKEEILGESIIVATGGTSRPETGSTGDAYKWMRAIGHNVIEPEPSLVPVRIKDKWVKEMQGKTLDEVKITVYAGSDTPIGGEKGLEKIKTKKGKILFTHFGVSGPTVLNMSKDIGEYIKHEQVFLSLDIKPDQDHGKLNASLQKLFTEEINKKIKNALSAIIPSALVLAVIVRAGIDPDKACNSITREERMALISAIKDLRIEVDGLLGTDKAIITSGGVDLSEIDFKTMRSRLAQNVFIIGDMLNVDRPSGGYSLQLCWTTGFVAGQNA